MHRWFLRSCGEAITEEIFLLFSRSNSAILFMCPFDVGMLLKNIILYKVYKAFVPDFG